ncbi:MAG TPA: tRNA pseudouridine(38-40) synthase TruA [Acidiferrobacteraceae bacterium]|nr:tRNA pseudouridine(38-40) synthase TruA [Acidiferrobacteraceae bacterium]
MRFAAVVEYDGSAFCGWQRQPGVATVQEMVEQALSRVADRPVTVVVAGRTDAGVHAVAQVFHFDTDAQRSPRSWLRGTNTHLPGSVALTWAGPVAPGFHARFSAIGRCYRYYLLNRQVPSGLWRGKLGWDYRPLDVERMTCAARQLLGRHDFTSFRATQCQAKSPIRELRQLDVVRTGDLICITATANAFLHHMVRNLVGVLATVGAGEREPEWAGAVLRARSRSQGGVTATPDGLYLVGVQYPAGLGPPATFEGTFHGTINFPPVSPLLD